MSETRLSIRILGDPILRRKAKLVAEVTEVDRQVLSKMARLMYDAQGIGLAAPQAGIDKSLIVIDIGSGLYKLINPKIISREGTQSLEEGCLSVPGASVKVRRSKVIKIKALDEQGAAVTIDAQGLLACVFQHEIDHLNGKLIIDYASILSRMRIKKKLEKLQSSQYEKLRESKTESRQL